MQVWCVVGWLAGPLHPCTPFSRSRSTRALHAGVLSAVFEPVTAALRRAGCRFRAIPPEQPEIVMNDKSHVSLEQHVCLVCGVAFDTGAILLDKRLRASLERHTATGWGLRSEEHTSELQSLMRISYAVFCLK